MMPFQPINFLGAPVRRMEFPDLAQELMKGMQVAQMPQRKEANELANALQKAKIQELESRADLPFGGDNAPGNVGQAQWLEKIKQQYGEDSSLYKNAARAFEADLSKTDYLNQYRQKLAETAPKRAATVLGKTEQEIKEIEEGYLPGSDRTVQLSEHEQKEMLERYQLERQKKISDTKSRERALFASNVDKTLEEIDPKDLTQYGGAKGQIAYNGDRLASALGKAPERFVKYQKALSLSNLLAKQVRQFYGDSITPQVQEKLAEMTNPANWSNNPEVALEKFKTFKDILEKETGTYRGAMKSTKEFEAPKSTDKQKKDLIKMYRNGRAYNIPANEVDEFLKAGGTHG
jgi:hypothetical protein